MAAAPELSACSLTIFSPNGYHSRRPETGVLLDRHQQTINQSSEGIVDFNGPKALQFNIMRKIWQAQRLAEEYYTMPYDYKTEIGYTNEEFQVLTTNVIERQMALLDSLNSHIEP